MNKFTKSLLLTVAGGLSLTACSFFTTPLGSADSSAGSTQDQTTSVQVSSEVAPADVESPQSKTEEVGLPQALPSEPEDTDSGSSEGAEGQSEDTQNAVDAEPEEEEDSGFDGTPDFGEGVSLVAVTDAGDSDFDSRADFNANGSIDHLDLAILGAGYGKTCADLTL